LGGVCVVESSNTCLIEVQVTTDSYTSGKGRFFLSDYRAEAHTSWVLSIFLILPIIPKNKIYADTCDWNQR